MKGVGLAAAKVARRGLAGDRRFMLVDERGDLLTQREIGRLATFEAVLEGGILRICAPDGDVLSVPSEMEGEGEITVRVWNDHCRAQVAGPTVNEWLSERLGRECRLVRMPSTTRRPINEKFKRGEEIVSFADGYPFLLIGEGSLADLCQRLGRELPMDRFRPNLVVEGAEPFAEDNWERVRIGGTVFRATKPCARCVVTTIDQRTGISEVKEPLRTLASYRRAGQVLPERFADLGLKPNDVLFGQNLVAENYGGELRVGDRVEPVG